MSAGLTGGIVVLALAGVIFRPGGIKELWPALAGAAALVLTGQLGWADAAAGVAQGADVYAFLAGMMLLSALASAQGLFAWVAAHVVRQARGDARRLFALLYGVAVVVTVFLSNDATAVVLTPAVAVVAEEAGVAAPLPYFFICAFVANAASFVLPISNPANLVVYGGALPALPVWLLRFGLASVVAVVATFLSLRLSQRQALAQPVGRDVEVPSLSRGGRRTGWGLAGTALVLLAASGFDVPLGAPTLAAALLTAAVVLRAQGGAWWGLLKDVSWSTLVLVAALFVLVAGLDRIGAAAWGAAAVERLQASVPGAPFWLGTGLGFAVNAVNNLPAGLLAGHALLSAPVQMKSAAMVGVDLGPNLSVTGSLATILWLMAVRKAGVEVSTGAFLRIGMVVMIPALILSEVIMLLS
jgi:arsenical pump membrane protein